MAHFVKPLGASDAGFRQGSNGALASMTIGPVGTTKVVVLWGGGRGGEILKLAALDPKGNRLATTRYLGQEGGHKPDPDGDDRWFLRYELKTASAGTGTLTALDKTGMPFARIELIVETGSVSKIDQTIRGADISTTETQSSVVTSSVIPFKSSPVPKGSTLTMGAATAPVHELLFSMNKDGTTYWIGACVPENTSDFTRAYVFFHPDTMASTDNGTYATFTGNWPRVQRYTLIQGVQLAEVRPMVLLVPFMTAASRTNQSTTNMFASHGFDTLNTIMDACQAAIGKTPRGTKLDTVGVASFSSGIEHLVRFAINVGGTGIIKEQIDFDSAFITKQKHSNLPKLAGATNIQVTQMSPHDPRVKDAKIRSHKWLQLDADAWPTTSFGAPRKGGVVDGFTLHNNIGNFMFRAMMSASSVT